MNRNELEQIWREALNSAVPTAAQFDRLAQSVTEAFHSGDPQLRQHIVNRLGCISGRFEPDDFDFEMARAFIADEIGFAGWPEMVRSLTEQSTLPLLFQYAVAAMGRGDFSALESAIGPGRFDDQIAEWFDNGSFDDEQETLAEIFAAACMLGHDKLAAYLLDNGVDPLAGTKTGLNGFHYAASSGRLDVVKLLIKRKVPMEVKNMYGGTVLGQALWSAVNEHKSDHAAIVEALIAAGSLIEPGTLEWWQEQPVPAIETKISIANALREALRNKP